MKFIVQNNAGYTAPLPDTLAEVEELLVAYADEARLFELMTMPSPPCGEHNHTMRTINGLMWDDITEFPVLGSTEIWTWHNQSGIAHPMHMHLVAFQILNRQAINEVTGEPEGPILEPEESEKGWKDTANCPPGFRTRVIARFDGFAGLYPYHCHILEHEDHEMMRQFEVRPSILVTDTVGSGPGSLPYAIQCTEAGDTVYFGDSVTGYTITLEDTLRINKDVTILNTHAGLITISGQNTQYIIIISPGADVSFEHINLISGNGNSGRALVNYGYLTLDDVTIYDSVVEAQTGDVILNHGVLMIRGNCNIITPPY